ncbi:hypothetical protein TWF506_006999 [Arthrobotrys conoides]|uniref:Uncharacterized protein n=1 Tax=Arthrobotrys conoides TaxID=74498 RepID=A0AAN8NUS1_9PEZI
MVRASGITRCRRRAPTQIPYGAGYITEFHRYGKLDIFKTVIYAPPPPETSPVTGYYIDYPSLVEHRLGEPARPMLGRWRFQELTFKVYANVNGEYEVVMPNVTASEDDTLDALVNDVIVELHDLEGTYGTENTLPREEGFSFDLQYRGSSLFQRINTENRQFGQRIELGDMFRREPDNVYKLLWKEYDARGRECQKTFYEDKLYHIIDLTSDTDEDEEDEEEEEEEDDDNDNDNEYDEDSEADTNTPPQTPGLPDVGEA